MVDIRKKLRPAESSLGSNDLPTGQNTYHVSKGNASSNRRLCWHCLRTTHSIAANTDLFILMLLAFIESPAVHLRERMGSSDIRSHPASTGRTQLYRSPTCDPTDLGG